MGDAIRCSNIIEHINTHAKSGVLFTSDIGLKNGVKMRSCCFFLDRLWAWIKGVSYDKNEVAKSITTAFQGIDLNCLKVSETDLKTFCKNINQLNFTFGRGSTFDQNLLIGVIINTGTHILDGQTLAVSKVAPPKTTTGGQTLAVSKVASPKTTTRHMDGALAARPDLKVPTIHPHFLSVKTSLLGQPIRRSGGVEPTGLKGIPNYSDNCFVISAYQLVKSNPRLYGAIFNSHSFKRDRRFDALREFDRRYDSEISLTPADMQKVRVRCLTQFNIPSQGQQDADEVLTSALFNHLPLTSFIQSTAIYEVPVSPDKMKEAFRGMSNVQVLGEIPDTPTFSADQVTVRIRKNFRREPISSLAVSLDRVPSGASLKDAITCDLSESRGDLFKLSPTITGKQVERQGVFTAGREITIVLKRFDNHDNKISKKIFVPNGQIQLAEEGLHTVKGFIVHRGVSKRYGHYVEYQKIGKQWYLNDDSRSEPVSTVVALNAMRDAYVLYAERD